MYDYRKLTPEERAEIVRLRRERGYPLHAPPHPFSSEGCFLITAANYEHRHIMHAPERRTEFEIALLEAFRQLGANIKGWVILPNHYHILIELKAFKRIAHTLQLLHGRTSRIWNIEDETLSRKVWYRYSDRMIRNEKHFYAALNYIHHNPVKHGYVERANEWMWSSVHLYLQDFGKEWLVEKWKAYPVQDFGKRWDEM
jgi:putative transposase